MRSRLLIGIAAVVVLLFADFERPQAASLGVYCWQLAPSPDVVCFDVDDSTIYAVHLALRGTQAVSGHYRYAVTGE